MDNSTAASSEVLPTPIFPLSPLPIPPTLMDITGVILIMSLTVLANAGGLGGGGTLTPFMMIFLKLNIFECVPLANVFGLIAATTRFIVNYRQKHPNPRKAAKGKLSIEYELVQLTMPILYLGTLIGVMVGTMLSEVVLAVSLASVLLFVAVNITLKAKELYAKENLERQKAKEALKPSPSLQEDD